MQGGLYIWLRDTKWYQVYVLPTVGLVPLLDKRNKFYSEFKQLQAARFAWNSIWWPIWPTESLQSLQSLQDSALQDFTEEEIVLSDLKLEKQDSADGVDFHVKKGWRCWKFSSLNVDHVQDILRHTEETGRDHL